MLDLGLICDSCGAPFVFTAGEQEFYTSKNLTAPRRCKACRVIRTKERGDTSREMHDAVCSHCGAQCEVPFKPRPVEEGGRPVLCKACFLATRT